MSDAKPCDIDLGAIIKDHIPLLFKLFKNDLKVYGLGPGDAKQTKCIYTAIMTLWIFLGRNALNRIDFCLVKNVQTRYGVMGDQSLDLFPEFKKAILSKKRTNTNSLFFVMLTHGPMKCEENNITTEFPGHTFVVEKINNVDLHFYRLYQSYVGHYNLEHNVKDSSQQTYNWPYEKMQEIVANIETMLITRTWTAQTTSFWKTLTKIEHKDFEGCTFGRDTFFFVTSEFLYINVVTNF